MESAYKADVEIIPLSLFSSRASLTATTTLPTAAETSTITRHALRCDCGKLNSLLEEILALFLTAILSILTTLALEKWPILWPLFKGFFEKTLRIKQQLPTNEETANHQHQIDLDTFL